MNFAFSVIIKSTGILMAAAVASLLLRRCSASLRHVLWILAISSAFFLPLMALFLPRWELSMLPGASTSVTFVAAEDFKPAIKMTEQTPAATGVVELFRPGLVWIIGMAL